MITAVHGAASNAKEHLFICKKDGTACSAKAMENDVLHADSDAAHDVELHIDSMSLDLLEAIAAQSRPADAAVPNRVPRVTGFMGSKRFILGWIDKHVPKDATSSR